MIEVGFRSGYVAITGRPNTGKSTLLNSILGEKVSIVTSKPQTTMKKIIGVRTTETSQIVFIDTPGIHKPLHKLGEFMVKEARGAIEDVDIVLFMVEPCQPGPGDKFILKLLGETGKTRKVFLLINKADLVKKTGLLPVIDSYRKLYDFYKIIPMSALNPEDVSLLMSKIVEELPPGPKYYPDDIITDQYEKTVVSELLREKIMEATEDEIPHSVAVEVIEWKERDNGTISISLNIYVERDSQKGIIIGKRGQRLKQIGSDARADIEKFLGRKVFIQLWVKVRKDWRRDDVFLKELGLK